MNRKQAICLWIGLSLIAILVVYPPYKTSRIAYSEGRKLEVNLGHRNVFCPIRGTAQHGDIAFRFWHEGSFKLDFLRLLLECLLIAVITAGGLWAFKNRKRNTD